MEEREYKFTRYTIRTEPEEYIVKESELTSAQISLVAADYFNEINKLPARIKDQVKYLLLFN